MASPSSNVIYCQGTFSTKNPTPDQLDDMKAAARLLNTSGVTTVILGQWHVWAEGQTFYNDTIFSDVEATLKLIVPMLKAEGGSVQKVLVTFGPFYKDFQHMAANQAAVQTVLASLQALGIDGVDWDLEQQYPQQQLDNLTTMTKWATSKGMLVTAAPYQSEGFWSQLLKAVGPNGFSWWNLQLYGGADYSSWVSELHGVDAQSFLVPGWKIVTGDYPPYGCVSSPSGVQQAVASLKKEYSSLSGAFLWTFENTSKDGYTTNEYVAAIGDGLKS